MRRRAMHQPSHESHGGAFGIPELKPPNRRQIFRVTIGYLEFFQLSNIRKGKGELQ